MIYVVEQQIPLRIAANVSVSTVPISVSILGVTRGAGAAQGGFPSITTKQGLTSK